MLGDVRREGSTRSVLVSIALVLCSWVRFSQDRFGREGRRRSVAFFYALCSRFIWFLGFISHALLYVSFSLSNAITIHDACFPTTKSLLRIQKGLGSR